MPGKPLDTKSYLVFRHHLFAKEATDHIRLQPARYNNRACESSEGSGSYFRLAINIQAACDLFSDQAKFLPIYIV